MIQIQICIKTKDLKSFVFIHFRKNREGVVDTRPRLADGNFFPSSGFYPV